MYLYSSQHPRLTSAAGRSCVHLHPLLSEHWGVEVERDCTDHNGWPIISSKEGRGGAGVVGELGVVRDYGGNGSIHQSVSNEGKNWSKSSRWKSCSARGGLPALSVSRGSAFYCCFVQQHPNRTVTAITLDCWFSTIYNILGCFPPPPRVPSVSHTLSWSTHIPLSLNISYITRGRFRRAWGIMAVCPSPPPLLTTHSCQHRTVNPTPHPLAQPSSSAVCYYAPAQHALPYSNERKGA